MKIYLHGVDIEIDVDVEINRSEMDIVERIQNEFKESGAIGVEGWKFLATTKIESIHIKAKEEGAGRLQEVHEPNREGAGLHRDVEQRNTRVGYSDASSSSNVSSSSPYDVDLLLKYGNHTIQSWGALEGRKVNCLSLEEAKQHYRVLLPQDQNAIKMYYQLINKK